MNDISHEIHCPKFGLQTEVRSLLPCCNSVYKFLGTQQTSICRCILILPRATRLECRYVWLTCRCDTSPAQRTAYNVIVAQHLQRMWGAACQGMICVSRREVLATEACGGLGKVGVALLQCVNGGRDRSHHRRGTGKVQCEPPPVQT
jgi:hypothetical protein